eukprot:gnl/TRDRNA2_/TRDRNA2_173374_c0_seq1.p1 gnl/TRDRNA2_/TRDRNA2_173374_c0~~gnl/TRDRNA2_/TRDRNA2_173374_c0_seq1.p1  ORF type:complete len:1602 (+),score=263.90 gnl/TRDRNA2_/TRDRNA2_173374_c0_seq1:84-4889(+)
MARGRGRPAGLRGPMLRKLLAVMAPTSAVMAQVANMTAMTAEPKWVVHCNRDCDGRDICAEGNFCTGEEVQTMMCIGNPSCPASKDESHCTPTPCVWTQWSEWQVEGCTGLCNRTRTFQNSACQGDPCEGSVVETKYCTPSCAPIQDCVLTTWGAWGMCGTNHQRQRTREIEMPAKNGGRPCAGSLQDTEPCNMTAPGMVMIDCVLTEWMEWSGCTKSCAGGQQTRLRSFLNKATDGGKACRGDDNGAAVLSATRPCNEQVCPTAGHNPEPCVMGAWSAWSTCSESTTQKYRTRAIQTPGKDGGRGCHDTLEETEACQTTSAPAAKPVDCKTSEWTEWQLCDKTCDGGQTFRHRVVEVKAASGGKPCQGELLMTKPCNAISCSADPAALDASCVVSEWTAWSECSEPCGSGIETRTRNVLAEASEGGNGCNVRLSQVRPCAYNKPCEKEDCEWDLWSEWSECTASCGGGQTQRHREVKVEPKLNGKMCAALDSTSEVKPCNTEKCDEGCIDGAWNDWEEWQPCSRTCTGGMKWRHRKIAKTANDCGKPPLGNSSQFAQCNTDVECKDDVDCKLSEWDDWGECSQSCDGVQMRSREIVHPGAGNGAWCTNGTKQGGGLKAVRPCNDDKKGACNPEGGSPVDCKLSVWTDWSECSASCLGGQQLRSRKVLEESKFGGLACDDALNETQGCNVNKTCGGDVDCEWNDWTEWGDCSKCSGEKIRTRDIKQFPHKGKPCVAEDSKEVAKCPRNCKNTFYCVWGDWSQFDTHCTRTCGEATKVRIRWLVKTQEQPQNESMIIGTISSEKAECKGSETDYKMCEGLPPCPGCTPQDCKWAPWADWSAATCDGLCTRTRAIAKPSNRCGSPCSGPLEESKSCKPPGCGSQDCQLGPWGDWSECENPNGQKHRSREVFKTAMVAGKECEGALHETAQCSTPGEGSESAEDCVMSDWSDWTDCTETCGGGQQSRDREVKSPSKNGGKPCEGSLRSMQICNTKPCEGVVSVDCKLSEWSEWMGCAAGSASKQATRSREVISAAQGTGEPCSGPTSETGVCPESAPVDCVMGDWDPWGGCDKTCEGGQKFRSREEATPMAFGGRPCSGHTYETSACNEVPCHPEADCAADEWSDWSACDPACGQGHQTRERKLTHPAKFGGAGCTLSLQEVQGCDAGPCTGEVDCKWGAWSEWGDCQKAVFCGLGFRERKRAVAVEPSNGGKKCDPKSKSEVKPDKTCPGTCSTSCVDAEWGPWGEWGACTATCGGDGLRLRKRALAQQASSCGTPAEGDMTEVQSCSGPGPCTGGVDCQFTDWSAWSPAACPKKCNGYRTHQRTVAVPSADGGKPCNGGTVMNERCNPSYGEADPEGCDSGYPVDCVLEDWSEWSECSETCGRGFQVHKRKIKVEPAFNGKACENPLEEIRECNTHAACNMKVTNCEWDDWQEWTPCDHRTGQISRYRKIKTVKKHGGLDCMGSFVEESECPRTCKDEEHFCEWGDWGAWGQCSTSCGTEGRQTRSRKLKLVDNAPDEVAEYEVLSDKDQQQIEELKAAHAKDLGLAFCLGGFSLLVLLSVAGVVRGRTFSAARSESLVRDEQSSFRNPLAPQGGSSIVELE